MGRIRVDFSFTVPYDQDIDQIRALVAEILNQDPRVLDTPPPEIGAEQLTELGVRIGVGPTVTPTDYWEISGDLLERIKARFDRDGIRFAVLPPGWKSAPPAHARETETR